MIQYTGRTRSSKYRISRRRFGIGLLTFAAATSVSIATPGGPVDELRLPPDLVAELERQAEPVLRQANMLAELPLEEVPPAFHFHPMRHARPL